MNDGQGVPCPIARVPPQMNDAERPAAPRIMFVLKRPMGAGGLQIQARAIALRLCEAGVPCTLLVHARSPRETRQYLKKGWPARIIECRSHVLFHLRLVRELWRLRRQYDVVHVHGFGREAITAAVGTR